MGIHGTIGPLIQFKNVRTAALHNSGGGTGPRPLLRQQAVRLSKQIRTFEAAFLSCTRLNDESGLDGSTRKPPDHLERTLNQPPAQMKTKLVLLTVVLATTAIWGCKKEESDDPTPPSNPPAPSESVFQELFTDNITDARQTFVLNASGGGQVFADQGTRLNFGPGAFLHADGTPVTGQVDVSVVEVLSIGNMIWLCLLYTSRCV